MAILESGRIHPPGLPSQNLIHVEARDARDALWAMEEGVRCAALSCRDRRIVGRPARARLHRDPAARGRVGAIGRAVLAGAAGRHREPERRADALADREPRRRSLNPLDGRAPGLPAWDAELFRARGMPPGRWSLAHEADRFHLVAASGDRALGEGAATHRLTAPVVLTVEGTHGLIIHAVTKAAAERGARPGARLTDARALDPGLVAVPADPAGDGRCCSGSRAGPAAGRRWSRSMAPTRCGSTSAESRICSAARTGWSRISSARFARLGLHGARRDRSDCRRGLGAGAIHPLPSGRGRLAKPSGVRGLGANRLAPRSPCPLPAGRGTCAARALHVSALRLDPDTVRTLERLGLKTIGALLAMPRLALARRFRGAEDVVDALDRMLGPQAGAADRRARRSAAARRASARRAGDPSRSAGPGARAADSRAGAAASAAPSRRAAAVAHRLSGRRQRRRRVGRDRDRQPRPEAPAAAARPTRRRRSIPEFGFDAFALTAEWTEEPGRRAGQPGRGAERRTRAGAAGRPADGQARAARGAASAGGGEPSAGAGERVGSALSVALPLRGGGARSDGRVRGDLAAHPHLDRFPPLSRKGRGLKRPQRLLDRPEAIDVIYATPEGMPRRFVWRRAVHDIARAEGPERIAPEWWRQPSSARLRDYYRVEDGDGPPLLDLPRGLDRRRPRRGARLVHPRTVRMMPLSSVIPAKAGVQRRGNPAQRGLLRLRAQ